MKKLILCAAAAVAMTGAGSVLAQPAECVVGILGAYTGNPCPNGQPLPQQPNYSHDYRYGPGGVLLSQIYGNNGYYYPHGYYEAPRVVVPRYQPTRRDRDGDGVRNRHDNYPDDPRYR